jgi:hypothetical protein
VRHFQCILDNQLERRYRASICWDSVRIVLNENASERVKRNSGSV